MYTEMFYHQKLKISDKNLIIFKFLLKKIVGTR